MRRSGVDDIGVSATSPLSSLPVCIIPDSPAVLYGNLRGALSSYRAGPDPPTIRLARGNVETDRLSCLTVSAVGRPWPFAKPKSAHTVRLDRRR